MRHHHGPQSRAIRDLHALFALLIVAAAFPLHASDSADPAQLFAKKCSTCHTIKRGAEHRQGPNLWGVVNRAAGRAPGFEYSAALANADFTWGEDRLNRWLTNPGKLVPGSVMMSRQRSAEVRSALIDFLKAAR